MFLSHDTILKYIEEQKIIIGPDFDNKNIRPVGIRIHLANEIIVYEPNQIVDLTATEEIKYRIVDLKKEEFYLNPGEFILGSTYEIIKTASNLLTILDGRSTIARLGLTTHITASTIDGLFEAPQTITLEIKNVGSFKIRLKEKDPIGMILFAELTTDVTQKLQKQYRDQIGVKPPVLKCTTLKNI